VILRRLYRNWLSPGSEQGPAVPLPFGWARFLVRLNQGDFDTRLAVARVDYNFTPYLSLPNLIQYDTDSRNLGAQNRFRWILKPGNELFLVWRHSWRQNPMDRFQALRGDVRAKVNYAFRF
jgi:hypothetical protein